MKKMKRQPLELVMENSENWFRTKPISTKRSIFSLLYYFIGHLFLMPLIFMVILSFFYDIDTSTLYGQAVSDSFNLFVFLLLFLPFLEESFEIFRKNVKFTIFNSIKWYIPMLLTNSVMSLIVAGITGLSESVNQETIGFMFNQSSLSIMIPTVVVAPLVEELIFRGIIFRGFRKFGFLPAALVSSISFGFLHVMMSLITQNYNDLFFVLIYAVMAFFFCLSYEKTKNIFGCYFLHLLNNVMAMATMAFLGMIIL